MPTDDYKGINAIKDIMLKHIVFSENILLELAKGEIGTLLRLYSPIFGQDREEVKDFKNTLQTLGPAFIIEKLLEDDSFFNQITTSILIEHLAAIVQQHLLDPTQLQAHQKWAKVG